MGNARAPESKARRGERRARPFLAGGRSPWLGPSGRVGMRIARNVSKGAQSHFMLNLFFSISPYLPLLTFLAMVGRGPRRRPATPFFSISPYLPLLTFLAMVGRGPRRRPATPSWHPAARR